MLLKIEKRNRVLVNTDPQKRCYNGCHYSSKLVDTPWETIQWGVPAKDQHNRLKFWRELNDYAISERGEGARVEYRAVVQTQT